MTTATTSSVWRSTGGDQTRTAAAGSMVMCQPFYIANAAASGANVAVSSSLPNAAVILPAGAVVTDVAVTATGTGNINLGFTPLIGVGPGQNTTLGTPVPAGLLAGALVTGRTNFAIGDSTTGSSLGNVANATNLVVLTSTSNTGSGTVSGVIRYFVADSGEENV